MKYIPLFLLIQLVSLVLTLVGFPLIAVMVLLRRYGFVYYADPVFGAKWRYQWLDSWMFVWGNREDGLTSPETAQAAIAGNIPTRWAIWSWSAWRNSVNNLRFCPGVSKVGRPVWLKTWTFRGDLYHAKAGWLPDGYPGMSWGKGPW